MSHDKDDIMLFVDEHFDSVIDKNTYEFVKELYEYISFLYDGTVDTDLITSESSEEEEDIGDQEKIKVKQDEEGFYSIA